MKSEKNKLTNDKSKYDNTLDCGHTSFTLFNSNAVCWKIENNIIHCFHSKAYLKNGMILDTRECKRDSFALVNNENEHVIDITYSHMFYKLHQHIVTYDNTNSFTIQVSVSHIKQIECNKIVVLDFDSNDCFVDSAFTPTELMMLQVPYDNIGYSKYENKYAHAGTASYDMSYVYNERSKKGLLLGALEFDKWKNAIVANKDSSNPISVISGWADEFTCDQASHGYLAGKTITSATFVCGFYASESQALNQYGSLIENPYNVNYEQKGLFGWTTSHLEKENVGLENVENASNFLKNHLRQFAGDKKNIVINVGEIADYKLEDLQTQIQTIHDRNQKVGITLVPTGYKSQDKHVTLKGSTLKKKQDILLKANESSTYHMVNGYYPTDITSSEGELDLREQLKQIVSLKIDYVNLDFLDLAALEGLRSNKEIVSGRQALIHLYNIIKEELIDKSGYPIYIALAGSPLFPLGIGNSRRICGNIYSGIEYTKHLLNALTFSYWASGFYPNLDTDAISLYFSSKDNKGIITEKEANVRYLASVISGGNMFISDNFGPTNDNYSISKAKERVSAIANKKACNDLVRLNQSFVPISFDFTRSMYYLPMEGSIYIALFNTENYDQIFTISPKQLGGNGYGQIKGVSESLSSTYNGAFKIKVYAQDATIIQII